MVKAKFQKFQERIFFFVGLLFLHNFKKSFYFKYFIKQQITEQSMAYVLHMCFSMFN